MSVQELQFVLLTFMENIHVSSQKTFSTNLSTSWIALLLEME